ncbi:hypothetical protein Btru_035690 [Bulinus truncatus]|nr:hypothetical protein Btru_035690 [Bulinus truncatus]
MSGRDYKQTQLNDFFSPETNKVSTLKRKHSDQDPDDMSQPGSYASKVSRAGSTSSEANDNRKSNTSRRPIDQGSKIDFPPLIDQTGGKNERLTTSEENGKEQSYARYTYSKVCSQSSKTDGSDSKAAAGISAASKSKTETHSLSEHSSSRNARSSTLSTANEMGCSKNLSESEPSPKAMKDDDSDSIRKQSPVEDSENECVKKSLPNFQDNSGKKGNGKVYNIELKPLTESQNHRILIDYMSISESSLPKPYPSQRVTYSGKWSSYDYVLMPYFSKMQNPPKSNPWGSYQSCNMPRWSVIQHALKKNIADVFTLEEAIKSYNVNYKDRWDFDGLYRFFDNMPDNERNTFFQVTLSEMRRLALRLEEICTQPLPILKQERSMKITISQQQAACLLANAFFCTFPSRNHKSKGGKLPDINFSNLYSSESSDRKAEKLKCLIHYFERVTTKMPTGTLTFTRQYRRNTINWGEEECSFTHMIVDAEGAIEDVGKEMLQADFANKMVGGGVLGKGLVQEEIRFIICPEMIVSRLFTETLTKDEVLVMTGCERFSNYTGYSDSFKYSGDHIDECHRDMWKRRMIDVVAMDALVIRSHRDQFKLEQLNRELQKAYCAFHDEYRRSEIIETSQSYSPSLVCTGNWGCGAFRGDKHLKAVIQMMAASRAGRSIYYCTFGDKKFTEELERLNGVLQEDKIKIKKMMQWISEYSKDTFSKQTLFEYIFDQT